MLGLERVKWPFVEIPEPWFWIAQQDVDNNTHRLILLVLELCTKQRREDMRLDLIKRAVAESNVLPVPVPVPVPSWYYQYQAGTTRARLVPPVPVFYQLPAAVCP